MGMAASQARFLGLTARKSNIEYQGQQVNQQRAALATESANLYHQMMQLEVPTPPVSTDFYRTTYTLEGSGIGNYSDYTIQNLTKKSNGTNEYTVKLQTEEKETIGSNNLNTFTKIKRFANYNDNGEIVSYNYTTTFNGSYIKFDANNFLPYNQENSEDGSNHDVLKIEKNKFYCVDETANSILSDNADYDAITEKLAADGIVIKYPPGLTIDENSTDAEIEAYNNAWEEYEQAEGQCLLFYQNESGKNIYLTEDQFIRITSQAFTDNPGYGVELTEGGETAVIDAGNYATIYSATHKYNQVTREVNATVLSNASGRYTHIQIEENDNYPNNLTGRDFDIVCATEQDQNAYNDAYNDYEYNKNRYEKAIQDINSQTEIIQAEDKQLELRLKQLDTEQKSVDTEIDSVSGVIKANIEKSFNTFA